MKTTEKQAWLEYCSKCKTKHIMSLQPCPDCGVHTTPQPKSEKVNNSCKTIKRCDGCDAYLDHLKQQFI